jgi:hypothetical protein
LRSKFRTIIMSLFFLALLTPFMAAPQATYAKGSDARVRGWVQARPANGTVGTWKIGGKTFTATAGTQIDQAEGPLQVGACAKVKYQVVNGRNQATEIDSEPAADCK